MAKQDQTQTGHADAQQHRWVVMVYLAGDNNLGDEMVWSLKSIAENSGDKFDVFAQYDSRGRSAPVMHYDLTGEHSRRYLEQNGGNGKAPPNKVVCFGEEIPNGNTVLEDLKAFIDRCMRKVARMEHKDALRFMLVLSGHGSGAVGGFLDNQNMMDSLSVAQLAEAASYARGEIEQSLGKTKELDIIAMDSCLMNMAEITQELEKSVRYMIGSQGFELNMGWPYHKILGILQRNPAIGTEDFVSQIVDEYHKYYSDYVLAGISTDLSACNLSSYRRCKLDQAMQTLTKLLRRGLEKEDKSILTAVLLAHWHSQSFKWEQYTDLWDFCHILARETGPGPIAEACEQVKQAIEGDEHSFVQKSTFSGPAFQHSHGLSVYFPWYHAGAVLQEYGELPFPKKTGWFDFLEVYLEKSRREPRRLKCNGARARLAFPSDPDQEVRNGAGHDVRVGNIHAVRVGNIHAVRNGNIHDVKYVALLAGTMKNPPRLFYATDEDLGSLLIAEENPVPALESFPPYTVGP